MREIVWPLSNRSAFASLEEETVGLSGEGTRLDIRWV